MTEQDPLEFTREGYPVRVTETLPLRPARDVSCVFYYFGRKWRLASCYPAPRYPIIIEPFAGAAGYSMFHLDKVERVILIEKDTRVVALWHRLLAMTIEELDAIRLPKRGEKTSDFLFMTTACSNTTAECTTITVTQRMTEDMPRSMANIRALLPLAKEKVTVIEGDYSLAPDIEATWFIDPPYQLQIEDGKKQTCNPKGMGYARGCDSQSLDYEALGAWSRNRKGQVTVCELAGASWLPFQPLRTSRVIQNSTGRASPEVVWLRD